MRIEIPALTEALIGHLDGAHAQMTGSLLHRLQLVQTAIAELDTVIAEACRPWAHQLELQTIPGVGEEVAQVTIAETCGDMCRFPNPTTGTAG